MRILQVAPFFNAQMGGSPRVVYELSRHLAERGHDVTVVASDYGDPSSRFEGQGFDVTLFPCLWAKMGFYVTPQMPRWLREHSREFDLVHMHEVRTFQNIVTERAIRRYGMPYFLSAHGTLPVIIQRHLAKRVFDRLFGHRILDGAARLIAVSPLEVTQYVESGIKPERIVPVRNGLDLSEFAILPSQGTFRRKLGLPDEARIVLFVGRLHLIKGIGVLVDAFRSTATTDCSVVLVIAGPDGGAQSDLRAQVDALGLQDRVIFAGPLYGAEKLAAYVDAGVVASPGVYEIFGLVAFEALMCGTPVVVSEDCGAGALIREAEAGATVPYGDVEALAAALRAALEDGPEIEDQITRGQAYIRRHLDWRANADALLLLYGEAGEGHSMSPESPGR